MPAYPDPMLFAEVQVQIITGGPDPSVLDANGNVDYTDPTPEVITSTAYSLCGLVQSKRNWGAHTCDMGLWDEADRGHIIWLRDDSIPIQYSVNTFAVVPGGSYLATGKGEVRVLQLANHGQGAPSLVFNLPYRATSWSLTSDVPPTSRQLDFSMTTFSLVRKTPRISQVGNTTSIGLKSFNTIKVFMSNDPSSPTHWLSQIRMDLQGNAVAMGTYQSSEINLNYDVVTKCDYQTCNGCADLNIMRLCYGAQQCTLARCIGTLVNQNRPLCGIGQTGQAVFTTMVVLINAAWNIFSETLTTVLGLSLDDTTHKGIQVRVYGSFIWATQYGF